MNLISLKIITPDGIKFDKNIELFETTTKKGRIGISANQTGLIAKLDNNISVIKINSTTKINYILLNGLLYSNKSEIKVFSDFCEEQSKISVENLKSKNNQYEALMKKHDVNTTEYKNYEYKININNNIMACLKKK